jgi:Na+/proline symporter
MGLLGFMAAGTGLVVPPGKEQMVNVFMIATYLPSWVSLFFVFVVFAGIVSILDSQFSSIASMSGHDIFNKFKGNSSITFARAGMIVMTIIGVGVACIPGITLLHIFMFFATLRASVWLPSMVAIVKPKLFTEHGIFWGLIFAMILGIPVYVYGTLIKDTSLALTGTVIAIFGSFIFSWMFSQEDKDKNNVNTFLF